MPSPAFEGPSYLAPAAKPRGRPAEGFATAQNLDLGRQLVPSRLLGLISPTSGGSSLRRKRGLYRSRRRRQR